MHLVKNTFNGNLRLICWNIEGLKNKLAWNDFIEFVTGYDIIGFVETWAKSNDDMCNALPGYSCFSTIRPKHSHKGRCSGGAAIYIRRELVSGIERINEIKLADSVFVKLSSIFFQFGKRCHSRSFVYITGMISLS